MWLLSTLRLATFLRFNPNAAGNFRWPQVATLIFMQLTFTVGTHEPHTVVYSWDQFWGRLSITVDGQNVVDTVKMFSVSLVTKYEFEVGSAERHRVRIEKHRAAFFAGFRPQPIFAYVDDVLVAQSVGAIGK